ncbi:MAG: hypothetical protein WC924_01550 [Candidatus Gracilibacteria bacterium]
MRNWKIALTSILLFTFVALPAIGQKLDLITLSSQVFLAEEEEEVSMHALSGEEEKEIILEKVAPQDEHWLLHFLKNVFSSAMSF